MAGKGGLSPAEFIEVVNDRVNLVEFLSAYTTLAQTGSEWRGRCPLHEEKTGSFYVNEHKRVWHCYGCGKGGNIFTFLKEKEGLEFRDAAELLAERFRLERIGASGTSEHFSRRKRLSQMHEDASRWFQQTIRESRGRPFQLYLRERDFTKDDVERFGIGAAPDEWEGLTRHLQQKGYAPAELLAAGLASRSPKDESRIYDRFRNRLIIPLRDTHGGVMAFAGRVIGEGDPKYLNSPETELFKKGRTLFALNLAKEAMRKTGQVVLMEGYTDVMRAHQKGLTHVVAAMGTALTTEQIGELRKFAKEVVLVLDSDRAGRTAAHKHAESLIRHEMPTRVMLLPEGQDPDDFLRQSPDPQAAFAERVQIALPAIEYLLRELVDEHRAVNDPQRRAGIRHRAFEIVRMPPSAAVQEEALGRLAQLLGEPPDRLRQELQHDRATSHRAPDAPTLAPEPVGPPLDPADRAVLVAMLNQSTHESLGLRYIEPGDFSAPLAQRLLIEFQEARAHGYRGALHHLPKLEFDPVLRAFLSELLIGETTAPSLEVFKQMLTRYRARRVHQERADVKRALLDAGQAGDHERARALLQQEKELGTLANLLERHRWPEDEPASESA